MFTEDGHDRTLPATPRRRTEARRQGHVPQSPDLATALMLGGVAWLLIWQGPGLVTACGDWFRHSFSTSPALRGDQLSPKQMLEQTVPVLGSLLGLLGGFWLVAILGRLLQSGTVLAPVVVQFQGERVSPMAGLRRMLSLSTMAQSPLWGLRLMAIGWLLWWTLTHYARDYAGMMWQPPVQLAMSLGEFVTTFALRLCGCLLMVGAIDFGWRWWLHERSLRMTPDELRAERRDSMRASSRHHRGRSHIGHSESADSVRAA